MCLNLFFLCFRYVLCLGCNAGQCRSTRSNAGLTRDSFVVLCTLSVFLCSLFNSIIRTCGEFALIPNTLFVCVSSLCYCVLGFVVLLEFVRVSTCYLISVSVYVRIVLLVQCVACTMCTVTFSVSECDRMLFVITSCIERSRLFYSCLFVIMVLFITLLYCYLFPYFIILLLVLFFVYIISLFVCLVVYRFSKFSFLITSIPFLESSERQS